METGGQRIPAELLLVWWGVVGFTLAEVYDMALRHYFAHIPFPSLVARR